MRWTYRIHHLLVTVILLLWSAAPVRAQQCNDGNQCTANDMCSNGMCSGSIQSGSCDDGNPCTLNDHCQTDPEGGVFCLGDQPAPDGTPCGGGCGTCGLLSSFPGSPSGCTGARQDNGKPCDLGGVESPCVRGECRINVPSFVAFCVRLPQEQECPDTDGNPCTDGCDFQTGECVRDVSPCFPTCETCNPTNGACEPTNEGGACDDFDVCTPQSRCHATDLGGGFIRGLCSAGEPTGPSPTPTVTPPSATPTPGACTGDCNGNGMVAINELVLGVNIALDVEPLNACPAFANSEGLVDIAQLIRGVNNALNGCGPANVSFLSQITGASPFAPDGCGLNTTDQGSEYEPDLAVSPTNQSNLIAVWTQDFNLSNVVATSQDGGQHWRQVLVPGLTRCTGGTANGAFDPRVSFGADGTAYISSAVGDDTSYELLANRSTDGGLSWSAPVTVDRVGSVAVNAIDFPVLTADPHRPGTAYLVWSRFHDLLTAPAAPQLFSRTTDGGTTWTSAAEIPIAPEPNQTAFASQIRVLPDGTLVDVFIQTPIALALIGPTGVWAVRSQDRGDSWSAPIFVADIPENAVTDPDSGQGLGRGATFVIPSVAIGPDQEVYIVWQLVESTTSSRILIVKSLDGGLTWSTPAPLAVEATQAFKPTVAVSPTGLIGVTYFDFRDDASGDQELTTDLWFRQSYDRGATWLETHLAGPFDIRPAPSPGGFPLGDYFGLIPIGSVGFGASFVQTIRPQGQGVTNLFFARIEVPPFRTD